MTIALLLAAALATERHYDFRKVASTVATSFGRIRKGARHDVYSVDRWGNCRKGSK